MRLRQAVAAADKKAAKDIELYYSKAFPQIGVTLIVDHRFVQQRQHNVVSYVIDKLKYDVTLMLTRDIVVSKPSNLYHWLDHLDRNWHDSTGVLPLRDITALKAQLQLQNDLVNKDTSSEYRSQVLRQTLLSESGQAAEETPTWSDNPVFTGDVPGVLW